MGPSVRICRKPALDVPCSSGAQTKKNKKKLSVFIMDDPKIGRAEQSRLSCKMSGARSECFLFFSLTHTRSECTYLGPVWFDRILRSSSYHTKPRNHRFGVYVRVWHASASLSVQENMNYFSEPHNILNILTEPQEEKKPPPPLVSIGEYLHDALPLNQFHYSYSYNVRLHYHSSAQQGPLRSLLLSLNTRIRYTIEHHIIPRS